MIENIYDFSMGDGQISFQTEEIIGKLDCIIIDTDNDMGIIIQSEKGYLILHRNIRQGVYYINPRNRISPSIEDIRDILGFEKFNLKEKILITIIGRKAGNARIILRIE